MTAARLAQAIWAALPAWSKAHCGAGARQVRGGDAQAVGCPSGMPLS